MVSARAARAAAAAFAASAVIACGSSPAPAPKPISNRDSAAVAPAATGSARVVTRSDEGGVIELSGDRERAMKQAEMLMATHCHGAQQFTITQEGEEAIGTDTSAGPPRTITAWRVHYACKLIDI